MPAASSADEDLTALLTLLQIENNSNQNSNWVSYPLIIGAVTASPSKATTPDVDSAFWRRSGDSMEITYTYIHTNNAGAAAGTGIYLFSLPSGYTIDSSKVVVSADTQTGIVGSMAVETVAEGKAGGALATYTNTALASRAANSSLDGDVGSALFDLADTTVKYSFSARVPILGWSN
ncbi:MAG: hypothetical protein KDK30_01595 [Leptospiraceae bacterium]|nr:hypothetical protein [Leptospiraceae bacterium]